MMMMMSFREWSSSLCGIVVLIIYSAIVLSPKGFLMVDALECEYYNITECLGGGNRNGKLDSSSMIGGGGDESITCAESRRTVTCMTDQSSPDQTVGCFVLWQKSKKNSSKETVQFKGCFINNKDCIGEESCVDRQHPKSSTGSGTGGTKNKNQSSFTHYCCCETNNCNKEYLWDPIPTTSTIKPILVNAEDRNSSSIIVFTLVPMFCALCVTVAIFVHRRVYKKPLPTSQSLLTDEENILLDKSESSHTLSPVTLVEIKASGRFGSVWKSSMSGHNNYVAVKILPLREKASWKLEQEVYSLPLMCDSEFILGYFGARSNCDGENIQLWLISEYIERGSLYDYLKGHVLTWNELLKVGTTMCQGLAFLHEEIDAGIKGVKPAVAHRDFKSKNVLLRPDLTACVADFGLAHIFYPTKPVGSNHGQVGTRRYMAPEVLDGAVSFTRDNFQRIDMYACGLVLWELASRCTAQQGPTGEYRLPFEEHVGQQPTLEEMIEAVVTNRKRPTIRNDWISHPGLYVLADAMKDAWDQDSEARISASCIVERLNSVNNKII